MASSTNYVLLVTSSLLLMMACFRFREVEGHVSLTSKPNILFILMDDMGWNDFGVHDPNMWTPTLDKLYNKGFRFNYSYVDPVGSSSRAALFSGNFSFRIGLQDGAINKFTNAHVPLSHRLLPAALEKQGYFTHLIGKWNQGFCNEKQTPTKRGFQTFFGQYTASTDHNTLKTEGGYSDVHEGNEALTDPIFEGLYGTEMWAKRAIKEIKRHKARYPPNNLNPFFIMLSLTAPRTPNQVPAQYLRKCRKGTFTSEDRRLKCGMMAAVDIALMKILKALEQTEMEDETLIFFTSDNGGDSQQGSSDWPLRGSKGSVWEGGIRVPSFIWSHSKTLLPVQNHTHTGAFHVVDWYPTLLGFALRSGKPNIPRRYAPAMDGKNHWRMTRRVMKKSFRTKFAYIVDEMDQQVAYVRDRDFKLVVNEENSIGWYSPPPGVNATDEPRVNWNRKPYLMFNVCKDPNETRDLSRSKVAKNANALATLLNIWDQYKKQYVAKSHHLVDSSPANHPEHNNVWTTGTC